MNGYKNSISELYSKLLPNVLLTLFFLLSGTILTAQEPQLAGDSLGIAKPVITDDSATLIMSPDTVHNISSADTSKKRKTESIDSPVEYTAKDSLIYALGEEKVYMYGDGEVKYKDIVLKAAIIEFDMTKELVFAVGTKDSTGKLTGKPVFTQGSESFESDTLSYNFRTKKGIIKHIFTEQEGGYLHSNITKRQANNEIHLKDGKYTTCDHENPCFYIALTKAKSIPGDKIVSGPAYFVIADVPLPIGIPFGFFPTTKSSKSGVLIPQYGEESKRGFYLRNGGYYLAISDFIDLRITGDIYTNGTWGLKLGTTYRKRYKFNGNLSLNYFENVTGEKDIDYSKSKDFAFIWSHSQDSKANPSRRFSANVNFSTGTYDQNHTRNINNVMRSTKQSSISFSKVWPNSPFNFNASANATQNSIDRSMNIKLPSMAVNMNRIYPFRSKSKVGKSRFYEDIQISYSSSLENRLNTYDTLLFSTQMSDFDNAYQHNIPVSLNLKALRYFNISPNLRYTGVIFTKTIHPQYIEDFQYPNSDIRVDTFIIDTVPNLKYAHAYVPSLSIDFSPKIFGMYTFREKSSVEAIRHVMTPRASFSYTPDMKGKVPDYYQTVVVDSTGKTRTYSLFDESIYRTPVPSGRQGSVSLSLMNNIEMKLKPKSDTIEEMKKIKLLDNFNFSTHYDIFKDSMRWSPISMSSNTSLLKKLINLRFGGKFDPYSYVVDKNGTRRPINTSLWKDKHQLLRMTNFDFSLGMNFRSKQSKSGSGDVRSETEPGVPPTITQPTLSGEENYYGQYVDFDVPWSLGINYNFNYTRSKEEPSIIQSLRINGDLSLTPKWKIGFNTGYDFTTHKVSMTNLSLYRDLHCWEMQMTVVPFGTYRSYSFQINIKSSILRDLKYEQGDNWYDNF